MGKTAKVVVCGARGVGKTAILEQLIHGHVTPETVRAEFERIKNEIDRVQSPRIFVYFCLRSLCNADESCIVAVTLNSNL